MCMHVQKDNNDDITHMHADLEFKSYKY